MAVWLVVGADDGVPERVALREVEAPGDATCDGVGAGLRVAVELCVPACDRVREVVALCVDVLDGLCVCDGDWPCDGDTLGVCDAVRVCVCDDVFVLLGDTVAVGDPVCDSVCVCVGESVAECVWLAV